MQGYKKIKVDQYDSFYDIIKKISSNAKDESFYLEIDENESMKNYLNLKILISKFAGKKFAIVTTDKEIRRIGEKLGIKYFHRSDDIEFEEKFSKTNVLKHNFTYLEYLKYEIKKLGLKYFYQITKKAKKTYKNKKSTPQSHIFLLAIGVILSFSLLSFIFYFAVSKTYVYIKPELGVKTVSRNIIFAEKENSNVFDTKSVIKVNPISVETALEFPFNVSAIDKQSAKNAYGKVIIYNELNTEQIFKPNTRFVTDDGIIYRSTEWIKVPPYSKSLDGKIVMGTAGAVLIADMYDKNSKIIGVRGNIQDGTLLMIPGLKFNRDKIYAKTVEAFHDGLDPKIHVLTNEEYNKFVGIISEKLKAKALSDMKEKIKSMNASSSSNFQIIPINNILNYNIGQIETLGGIKIGDKTEEIKLKGTGSLSAFVFDKNSTVFYLKTILNENILLGTEKLIGVNEDSLKVTNILTQTANPFYMKATTELDSTISYNFEDSTNNLTKKLKNLIANTSVKEATSILLNDSNIANVKIEFSPFWLTRISNNPDNIEFIIEK